MNDPVRVEMGGRMTEGSAERLRWRPGGRPNRGRGGRVLLLGSGLSGRGACGRGGDGERPDLISAFPSIDSERRNCRCELGSGRIGAEPVEPRD